MFILVVCPSLTPFRLQNTGLLRSSMSPRLISINMSALFIAAHSSITESGMTLWLFRLAVATSLHSCSSYFLAPLLIRFSQSAQFDHLMPRFLHYPLKIVNWDSAVFVPEQNLSSSLLDASYAVLHWSRTLIGPMNTLSWMLSITQGIYFSVAMRYLLGDVVFTVLNTFNMSMGLINAASLSANKLATSHLHQAHTHPQLGVLASARSIHARSVLMVAHWAWTRPHPQLQSLVTVAPLAPLWPRVPLWDNTHCTGFPVWVQVDGHSNCPRWDGGVHACTTLDPESQIFSTPI